ncbi:MAG: hypothetical protein H7257_10275 [Taibaiella sp.]|nr:hypothetical protein [Taibaiella sp.]
MNTKNFIKSNAAYTIIAFLMLISTVGSFINTAHAQSGNFTCFQKNYGEGAGWEKANFKIKIDIGNHKISIYDPQLKEFISFSPWDMYSHEDIHTLDEKTTLIKGKDQIGLPVKVFIALTNPPTLTVLYLNTSIGQIYKLK